VKVVFLEDVPDVAEVGEIKEVADGYGRNYLLPRKLAVLANSAASNILEAQLKKKARLQAQTEVEMTELARQLEGKEITLKAKAGSKERLYGSITSADIVEGISNSLGLVIDKKKVELTEPIRELGSYEVPIRLFKEIIPRIMLTVVEEKAEEKKEDEDKVKEKKKSRAKKKTGETKAEAKEETEVKTEAEELPAEEKAEEKKKDKDKVKEKKRSRAKKKTEPKAEVKEEAETKETD